MTAARPDTWMPFYIGDYLADTMHLSRSEHGGYVLLLMAYWRNGGPIPDDDDYLRKVCKADVKEWPKLKAVLARFFTVGDGVWTQKRASEELNNAAQLKEQKSNAGKASARAKRQRKVQQNANTTSTDVQQTPHETATEPPTKINPLPSPSSVPNGTAPPGADLAKALFGPCLTYLTANGVPERNARSLLGKWRKSHGDSEVLQAVRQAEANAVSEPVAWLERVLGGEKPLELPPDPDALAERYAADWDRQTQPQLERQLEDDLPEPEMPEFLRRKA